MKRNFILAAVLGGLLHAASSAQACGGPGRGFIRHTLPDPMPDGVLVAEVELETPTIAFRAQIDIPARVIRVIQGPPGASVLILRWEMTYSCDSPFGNGSHGFIVAAPAGYEDGIPIVHPAWWPVESEPGVQPLVAVSPR